MLEDDGTPPIMWPERGSGFEASGFSPAGRIQRQWSFIRGVQRRNTRSRRLMMWGIRLIALVFVGGLVVDLVRLIVAWL